MSQLIDTCCRPWTRGGRGVIASFVGCFAALTVWIGLPDVAFAQQVAINVDADTIYAEMPFVLSVTARGFAENPEPTISGLQIPGARVDDLGMTPNVSSMVTIINGRRSESRDVTFTYRYRIEVPTAGTYTVPELTVSQGTTVSTTQAANFTAQSIEPTRDMQIRVGLPERPMWVGETFEVTIDWFLKRDVQGQTFVVPLFADAAFDVKAPDVNTRQMLDFDAGGKTLSLPYERDNTTLDGESYTRFRFRALVTPLRAGKNALPPARVMAQLQVGQRRDRFGFPVAATRLFKAEDVERNLDVRPLPLKDRPQAFANAVGTDFSIQVQADHTVVKVGDPVELRIQIRGEGHLTGLILPKLDNAGLSRDLFSAPDSVGAAEDSDDGGKIFRVSVRVKSDRVREIPPLAFSYFDPVRGGYQTVRSQPIALSVTGAARVGAQDVVSAAQPGTSTSSPSTPATANTAAGNAATTVASQPGLSLVGADLGLSDPGATLAAATTLSDVWPWTVALYVLPLAFFGWSVYRRRTHQGRTQREGIRDAHRALQAAIDAARNEPARDAAPRLSATTRQLLRVLQRPMTDGGPTLTRLETDGFDPRLADRPVARELCDALEKAAAAWVAAADTPRTETSGKAVAAVLLAAMTWVAAPAPAQASDLDEARSAYEQAMTQADRAGRTAGFARAEVLYQAAVEANPGRPELLVDWGNAALGAQDLGTAVLAYRRALLLDAGNTRAQRNLAWVRSAQPDWLPHPDDGSAALSSLFFWNRLLTEPMRALLGAVAFALAVLLLVPWRISAGMRRTIRLLAIGPCVVWLWLSASLLVTHGGDAQAVVMTDGILLRSADSLGATPTLRDPLPAGAEVQIVEQRGDWSRLELADGQQGWVQASAVTRILSR